MCYTESSEALVIFKKKFIATTSIFIRECGSTLNVGLTRMFQFLIQSLYGGFICLFIYWRAKRERHSGLFNRESRYVCVCVCVCVIVRMSLLPFDL